MIFAMAKKNSVKNQVKIVPPGISGFKTDSPERIRVDYDAVARAIADNDLHHRDEAGNVTGLHLPHCTILVQKLTGNKYRGQGAFGWTIWVKPKHK
jgi:hypothetical protein